MDYIIFKKIDEPLMIVKNDGVTKDMIKVFINYCEHIDRRSSNLIDHNKVIVEYATKTEALKMLI